MREERVIRCGKINNDSAEEPDNRGDAEDAPKQRAFRRVELFRIWDGNVLAHFCS